jgi:hypothetical protein
MKKWFRRGLKAIAEWCQENRHMPVEEQQKTLNARLRGHYQYYGRATNYRSIWQFFREVRQIWRKWLSRRTRGNRMTWEKCHLGWAVQYWRGVPSAPIIPFRATGRLVCRGKSLRAVDGLDNAIAGWFYALPGLYHGCGWQ